MVHLVLLVLAALQEQPEAQVLQVLAENVD
jgi:hypothetical protein